MVNDPIADMLTRIRNAFMVGKDSVLVPDSRMKRSVLEVMKRKGYIADFTILNDAQKYLDVKLLGQNRSIKKIERVSKPGCRIYTKNKNIPTVRSGMGMVIVSTSKGMMTGIEAKEKGLGGEIVCKIY